MQVNASGKGWKRVERLDEKKKGDRVEKRVSSLLNLRVWVLARGYTAFCETVMATKSNRIIRHILPLKFRLAALSTGIPNKSTFCRREIVGQLG